MLCGVAVAIVVALAVVGCGGDGDDGQLGRDVDAVHEDAVALARGLDDLVEAAEPILVERCVNDGSGPYGPVTRIDLDLRPGTTIDDLRQAAEAELRRLDFEIVPVEDPDVTSGTRALGGERNGQIRLYGSSSSSGDVVIGTALVPAITC